MALWVDGGPGSGYTAGIRALFRSCSRIAPFLAVACVACSARPYTAAGPVSYEVEREAIEATVPDRPLRVVFDWRVLERDARFTGKGVARVQPPYHARLDLFGPRGESYLSAAAVDGELRLPPSVSMAAIPPVPLLWSALGIFLPPQGARLVVATRDGEKSRLEYEDNGARWRFELVGNRMRKAEWVRPDGARATVELKGNGPFGIPNEAVYRDWAAFTELTLKSDEVESVGPFPPEIWRPDAY